MFTGIRNAFLLIAALAIPSAAQAKFQRLCSIKAT